MNDPHNPAAVPLRPIEDVGRELGLRVDDLDLRGPHAARVRLGLLEQEPIRRSARYVVVAGVTPTRAGAGVTTHAIGLSMALNRIGTRAVCTIRLPCAGAMLGAGGDDPGSGRCRIVPAAAVEAESAADARAVAGAHDLIGELPADGPAASEVMAVLSLAKDPAELRERLSRTVHGAPVDAMLARLRHAFEPLLMQTTEGTPALLHGAPSVVADLLALRCADFVVTEAPAGTDVGAERFCNVKCRASGLRPDAAVLVCTARTGADALAWHIENLRLHGLTVVAAVNQCATDGAAELERVRAGAVAAGAVDAVVSSVSARGGAGGEALARAVERAVDEPSGFQFLYPGRASLRQKIEAVAVRVLRARGVSFSTAAAADLDALEAGGCGGLPVCVARPPIAAGCGLEGGTLAVHGARAWRGAGFVMALAGVSDPRRGPDADPIRG